LLAIVYSSIVLFPLLLQGVLFELQGLPFMLQGLPFGLQGFPFELAGLPSELKESPFEAVLPEIEEICLKKECLVILSS
jgi:hypothetical protein